MRALNEPSVVTLTPSLVLRLINALAVKAEDAELGLQNTSKSSSSALSASPASKDPFHSGPAWQQKVLAILDRDSVKGSLPLYQHYHGRRQSKWPSHRSEL